MISLFEFRNSPFALRMEWYKNRIAIIAMIISRSNSLSFVSRCSSVPRRKYNDFQRNSRSILVSSLTVDNRDEKNIFDFRTNFSSVAPEQQLNVLFSQRSQRSSMFNPIAGKRIQDLRNFVDRIPAAVRLRKKGNHEPGAIDDPVARLFRWVSHWSPFFWSLVLLRFLS